MYAEDWTEEKLEELEKKIAKIYKQASDELTQKAAEYFAEFENYRFQKEYEAHLNGAYTKTEFANWMISQIGRGQRWETLRDAMAKRLTEVSQVAASYINDYTPGIYSLNANFEAFIAEGSHEQASFVLVNEEAVKRLIVENPRVLPKRKVNVEKDKKWNEEKIQNELTQAVLQGEPTSKLADRFVKVVGMSKASAIRNARTAVTNAQNGGTYNTSLKAYEMGLPIKNVWRATKDLNTRPSHRRIDGEEVEPGEKFSNGLRFPGDMDGEPSEVYGCRCALVTKDRIQVEQNKMRVGNPEYLALGKDENERKKKQREIEKTTGRYIPKSVVVNEMNYKEWYKWKSKYA